MDAYGRLLESRSYEGRVGIFLINLYLKEKGELPIENSAVCAAGKDLYEGFSRIGEEDKKLVVRLLVKLFW